MKLLWNDVSCEKSYTDTQDLILFILKELLTDLCFLGSVPGSAFIRQEFRNSALNRTFTSQNNRRTLLGFQARAPASRPRLLEKTSFRRIRVTFLYFSLLRDRDSSSVSSWRCSPCRKYSLNICCKLWNSIKYIFETENVFSFNFHIPKYISKCMSGSKIHFHLTYYIYDSFIIYFYFSVLHVPMLQTTNILK